MNRIIRQLPHSVYKYRQLSQSVYKYRQYDNSINRQLLHSVYKYRQYDEDDYPELALLKLYDELIKEKERQKYNNTINNLHKEIKRIGNLHKQIKILQDEVILLKNNKYDLDHYSVHKRKKE